ncbi:hypothetical protein I552_7160 [Mycobacterium xenopi 3993]|nr:hypothetical protein I552_7160 [Mycobacterium xenopi 3993]
MLAGRKARDRGDAHTGVDRDGHHRRRDAHRVGTELGGFRGDGSHVGGRRLGFEQGVVDEGRYLATGELGRHYTGSSGPPGLQPDASIVVSSTTGRHGSRFQLALPGCASSASCQWQTNCARIPAVSASGAWESTSLQALSACGPKRPAAARAAGVG